MRYRYHAGTFASHAMMKTPFGSRSPLPLLLSLALCACASPDEEPLQPEPAVDAFSVEQVRSGWVFCSICSPATSKTILVVQAAKAPALTGRSFTLIAQTDKYLVYDVKDAPSSPMIATELTRIAQALPGASFHWLVGSSSSPDEWRRISLSSGIPSRRVTANVQTSELKRDRVVGGHDGDAGELTWAQLLAIRDSAIGSRPLAAADAADKTLKKAPTSSLSRDDDSVSHPALDVIARLIRLNSAFDPTLTDLYSSDATITTRASTGAKVVKATTMNRDQFKAAVWSVFPQAKKAGSLAATYSQPTLLEQSSSSAVVQASRTTRNGLETVTWELSKATGKWLITQETAEASPAATP